MIEELRLRDEEIARLKNVRPVFSFYKAFKGDPIDEQLAIILNGLAASDRPRFEFVR